MAWYLFKRRDCFTFTFIIKMNNINFILLEPLNFTSNFVLVLVILLNMNRNSLVYNVC